MLYIDMDGMFLRALCVQINEDMMEELKQVKEAVNPSDTLLVVDAMTGQEAAALTKAFNDAASITGEPHTKVPSILHSYVGITWSHKYI